MIRLPPPVRLDMEFTLTSFGSVTEHLISFGADKGTGSNAYGFAVAANGGLTFGRMGTNNLTSTTAATTFDNGCSTAITTLRTDTRYHLTLQSHASGSPVGRGADNFTIVLTNLTDTAVSPVSVTAAGFGLNGNSFANLRVGSNITAGTMAGTVSKLTLVAPEPATATRSLLALAGLVARRRRH